MLFLGARFQPLLRLLQFPEDHQRQRGWQRARQEHVTPGAGDDAGLLHVARQNAGQRRNHVAQAGASLYGAERVGPRAGGSLLGNQGHADPKLASHAQSAQEPVDVEVPDASGENAQAGEDRKEEDGQRHGLSAAQAVAQHSEDHAAQGPADHEDGRGVTGLGADGSIRGPAAQQVPYGVAAAQHEKLLGTPATR